MPRVARIVLEGQPQHITQRGNNRQDVFFLDDDRLAYLELLHIHGERFGFRVLGYCLMTNHVHLIGVPARQESLAKAVGRTNFRYTQYINRMHGRSGHLWQNRFYSCALDDVHLCRAMCYVEQNPVRAKMVRVPWRYRWSSAAAHVSDDATDNLLDMRDWKKDWTPRRWRAALTERPEESDCNAIRLATHRGRPLATDSFLSKLEHRLARRVRALPVGRPRNQTPTAKGRTRSKK